MPSKYDVTVELSAYTAHDLSVNPQNYMAFLTTAGRNYKYSFEDQLLIFAQKPDATACAEIATWNKLGRFVNKGTKGITLLVNRDIPYKLRHVFDLSDTNSYNSHEVELWQMQNRYEESVLETLNNSFGEIDSKERFEATLIDIAAHATQDHFVDYFETLISVRNESLLEEYDRLNIEVKFKTILQNSIGYMLLTRCGYKADLYYDADDFSDVTEFNTGETIAVLGNAESDIAEMILREIEQTIRTEIREEKKNRTVAEKTKIDDNIVTNKQAERGNDYGTDLQTRGRLSSSESKRTGDSEDWEIWNAASQLSSTAEETDLYGDAAVGQTERSSDSDRSGGSRDDGEADSGDGGITGREREPESDRSDEVGADDEQYQSIGGGDSPKRADLQLSGHDFDRSTGIDYYYNSDEKNELLRNCEALKKHRKEIAAFFESHEDREERGNFIKTFFDNTFVEHILENGQRVGYRAYDDLLHIWRGSYLQRDKEVHLKWWGIADHIYGQILLDEWLSDDEKLLIDEKGQLRLIAETEQEKRSAFVLPQAAIDYFLCGGNYIHESKYCIYEQFKKQESKDKNIAFLKKQYGIGGTSDPIPGTGFGEWHDGKGIQLSKGFKDEPGYTSYTLSWSKVEKRIGELIVADRYLNRAEKERYPAYLSEKKLSEQRWEIASEFNSIIRDFNDFETQIGNDSAKLNTYVMTDCGSMFGQGKKITHTLKGDTPSFILPMMRDAMQHIIAENTHLTERCQAMLISLDGELAKSLEPTFEELNPPPEPPKEYKLALGDVVYIGTKEYEILSLEDPVVLFDPEFPILNEEIPKEEFDAKIKENPLNDKYLKSVETEKEPIPDEDRFFIYPNSESILWMYYNPDSSTGGQYISNRLTFDEIREAAKKHPDTENFFDYLGTICQQELADIDTELFADAAKDFNEKPDFIGCTDETKNGIMKLALEIDEKSKDGLWKKYSKIKVENPNDIVLYQVGDFYEVMGEDAKSISETLDLYMVNRDSGNGQKIPMCGFPKHALESYMDMLHRSGHDIILAHDGKTNRVISIYNDNPKNSENDLDHAKQLINEYCQREFESDADYSDLSKVPLAYTTISDELTSTQVDANLVDFSIDRYISGTLVDQWKYDSLVDMCTELANIDFDTLISYTDEQLAKADSTADEKPIELSPQPKKKRSIAEPPHVLLPDIPSSERCDFRITDDEIGVGTPLERFNNNLAAIRVLTQLEEEKRLATPDEQHILSKYVGWGGLADYFKEENPHYTELRELLTDEEYASARESTMTAFYTPPVVIKAVYEALENMNFRNGNILEPSCGIGNFMGLVPESMKESKFYGVELDSISGRIAQHLYQNSNIAVQGFEKTNLPDSFFDAALGNVPFGTFKLLDKRYDKNNFLVHDFFFAKTLDKVRPGGIIAFITSCGTMDKKNPAVRKYIAQRADLLGAIRLPNNTFKAAAGTGVPSDIIFLQKRDRMIDIEPDWVHLNTDENGIKMNQYFIDNPDMILGEMQLISGAHGDEPACIAYEGQSLEDLLHEAVQNIHAEFTEYEFDELTDEDEDKTIPADPNVKNFSYTVVDGTVYYRENSRMKPVEVSVTAENRIKNLIAMRECVRTLIEYQTEDFPDEDIKRKQSELNELYDAFSKKYGLINSRANNSAFSADSSYFLLCSLEILDDEGNFVRKADMFSKRTIRQKTIVTSVDTASEALAMSLAEKMKVDIPYMCELTGKSEEEITSELKGVIFLNPQNMSDDDMLHPKYLTADEYLSGNIRDKLALAKRSADLYPEDYAVNVEALEKVLPVDLSASEISVRLGSTWIPVDDINNFMWELFGTPRYQHKNIKTHFSRFTGEWNISGKSYDNGNVKASNTYGTGCINGYKILEETLNLKDVRIFDYVEDEHGNRKPVLNKKETAIAQGKQQLIKEAFNEWIWKDPERRERLCRLYNDKFNSTRPREYNGEHLRFVGMNPEITLRPHQVNAIAHILHGGNTLLAHVVGAGKTFEMVAAAQESKRLGLCQKSMFVVPNHLTEQWASEYLQLYPSANILVATKKDFETKNRKKFCGRIATGDYDAVIIGHSQFEKIPMSAERQIAVLEQELSDIVNGISELKRNQGDSFSIKQMERSRKSVKQKLEKLNDQSRKDDIVTLEELGIDRIFIDEAHYYKNLAAFTKMRNVGGISQTEAQKSSDLYMKCRYLDEITGGRGIVFATGTPISNSMVELYTMQKYLQYGRLSDSDLIHFDSWASTFGETVTALELAPEGNGYRSKTRFAKFFNLPELMSMFKEVADIQTADMLKLPVPKVNRHNIKTDPSEIQIEMLAGIANRAEKIRAGSVDPRIDNLLKVTNDGRKLALDQRMMNEMLPDSETSKVSVCADNVFDIWQRTAEKKSTQLVFCDLSTPKGDGSFNIYDDLKNKLMNKGVPEEEIAFIHSANTEAQKKEMFGKVRSGQIRVLIGSTQKMGAGTNVQKKLVALHHLDCPWRPSDLQQREGRIIRQGNENPEVDIYTYVTENTFDSYLYQLVESKQKFIGQIMTGKSPVRSAEDVDEQALSYAEIKALCAGDPHIKEKMDLEVDVARLKVLKANHLNQRYALEDEIIKHIPAKIASLEQRINGLKKDIIHAEENTHLNSDGFSPMTVNGITHTDKKEAGTAILESCKVMTNPDPIPLGQYRGFEMELSFETIGREYRITLKNELRHTTPLGTDIFGNIQRLDNLINTFSEKQSVCEAQLENEQNQLESAKIDLEKPFAHEEELKIKSARLAELNAMLDLNKKDNEIVDGGREDTDKKESECSDCRDAR